MEKFELSLIMTQFIRGYIEVILELGKIRISESLDRHSVDVSLFFVALGT